ncbi:MAG: hypothetical protein WCI05_17675 [Myxococcales bacterium]|jgi:hypothetical protein
MIHRRQLFLFVLLFGLVACTKTFIPNTDVEDTSENRRVIAFCESYRHAVEERDIATLLKLVSPGYFDNAGNTNSKDDYDYNGLRDFLTKTFVKTTAVRYEIRYRRLTLTESAHIWVDYTYAASFRIPGVKAEEWQHKVSDNRLDLVRDGDSFKIVSGM